MRLITSQNWARWKASMYWVLPTFVPPKLKSVFVRIGDCSTRRVGMLLGAVETSVVGVGGIGTAFYQVR